MLFDFTKEVSLNEKSLKTYWVLRIFLYVSSGIAAAYIAFLILFPTQYFIFSFLNPNSSSNTVLNPRESGGAVLDHGRFPAKKSVLFETPVIGNFSSMSVNFLSSKKSEAAESGKVVLRKSYQAFLYPEIEYVADIIAALYDRNGGLPYSSGTIISNADSVYVVSKDKIFPVDSVETFLALGYKWDDVLRASSDEFSFYKKGPLLTLSSAHPDGTILFDTDTKQYFVVTEGKKMHIPADMLRGMNPRVGPINASSTDAKITADCALKKRFSLGKSLSCTIPLENFQGIPGKDFQFAINADTEMRVDEIDARFIRDVNYKNLRFSLSTIFNRIKSNYASNQ